MLKQDYVSFMNRLNEQPTEQEQWLITERCSDDIWYFLSSVVRIIDSKGLNALMKFNIGTATLIELVHKTPEHYHAWLRLPRMAYKTTTSLAICLYEQMINYKNVLLISPYNMEHVRYLYGRYTAMKEKIPEFMVKNSKGNFSCCCSNNPDFIEYISDGIFHNTVIFVDDAELLTYEQYTAIISHCDRVIFSSVVMKNCDQQLQNAIDMASHITWLDVTTNRFSPGLNLISYQPEHIFTPTELADIIRSLSNDHDVMLREIFLQRV